MSDRSQTDYSSCPTQTDLSAFLNGGLDRSEREKIELHLAACEKCVTFVNQLPIESAAADNTVRISKTNRFSANKIHLPEDPAPNSALLEPLEGANPTASYPPIPSFRPEVPLPSQLGQYRLLQQIGAGGMGTVYRAEHLHLKKPVAVKLVSPNRLADETVLARFRREMEVVGRLDHPNIVRATDAGETDSIHYLVMEFIDGLNLTQIVKRCGPLPVAESCELIRQAALGLQHAYENGLVHRDIKPQNLMLNTKGQVKVLDLGLALLHTERFTLGGLTCSGQVMGTADYMAPEQWEDCHWVDIRADLYSLGCTLFFLLTGSPPFGSPGYESIVRKMAAHLRDDPLALRPDVGAASAILARMLAKEPAQRPQTPEEVVQELTPLATGANLLELSEKAAKCVNPDDEATGSHAGGVRPLSTIASARLTVNLKRPRGRGQWSLWVSAGIVLLVVAATMILYPPWKNPNSHDSTQPISGVSQDSGSTSTINQQPLATASTNNPESKHPDTLAENTWVMLLQKEPKPRLWPKSPDSVLNHNPQKQSLGITSYQSVLIPLGKTTTPEYQLQIGIRQPTWQGSCGVYFGGHMEDGKFHFQVIHLEKAVLTGGFALQRSRGTIEQIPPPLGDKGAALVGFASENLNRPLSPKEYLLDIEVKTLGRLNVRWDGDSYQELTAERHAGRVSDADYHGEFGIFSQAASSTVTMARIYQTP